MSETYASSGVNIEAGSEAVRRIKPHVARTHIPGVLGGLGGFGGLFQLDLAGLREPVLVSGTDSVGSKLKLAFALNRHDTIGRDCVAMSVNDVLCSGARPLFFLDYIGIARLEPTVAEAIVKGVADGCVEAGCALIGGEMAELPGLYSPGEYDLVGACVGIVEKSKILDGLRVRPGDAILGLPSSGLHSNSYSLARKLLEPLGYQSHHDALGQTIGETLLEPTRIYVKPILQLLEQVEVRALAHITGGGFYENIPRVLPPNTRAVIEGGSWRVPPIFGLIQEQGQVEEREMFTTFNMGVGMIAVVAAADVDVSLELLRASGVAAMRIGTVEAASGPADVELR